jgi:hypothetical protein
MASGGTAGISCGGVRVSLPGLGGPLDLVLRWACEPKNSHRESHDLANHKAHLEKRIPASFMPAWLCIRCDKRAQPSRLIISPIVITQIQLVLHVTHNY